MKVTPVEGRQGNAIVRFQDWIVTKDGPQSVIGIFSHSSEVPEIGKDVEVMISGVRVEGGRVKWLWLTVVNEDFVRVKFNGFIRGNNGIISYGHSFSTDDTKPQEAVRFWLTPGATGVRVVEQEERTAANDPGIGYVAVLDMVSQTKRSVRLTGVDHYKQLAVWHQLTNQELKDVLR